MVPEFPITMLGEGTSSSGLNTPSARGLANSMVWGSESLGVGLFLGTIIPDPHPYLLDKHGGPGPILSRFLYLADDLDNHGGIMGMSP